MPSLLHTNLQVFSSRAALKGLQELLLQAGGHLRQACILVCQSPQPRQNAMQHHSILQPTPQHLSVMEKTLPCNFIESTISVYA